MPGEWTLVWPLENWFLLWESSIEVSCGSLLKESQLGTSLVTQWLRLHAPNAGGPFSIPDQGTRSHISQLRPSTAKYKTYFFFFKKGVTSFIKKQESQSKGFWGLSLLPFSSSAESSSDLILANLGSHLSDSGFTLSHSHFELLLLWPHPQTLDLLRMESSSSLHLCLPNLPCKWLCWE